MDDIIVIDDFLTEEEVLTIANSENYHDDLWSFQGSVPMKGLDLPVWAEEIDTKLPYGLSFLRKNLMPYEYFTSYLFDKIKEKFNQDYKLQDVYMNGQEPLRNGSFHVDGDADRTVVIYLPPYRPAWGGFTHLLKSATDHEIISPLPARLINFKSSLLHKAYAFANSNCPCRFTVCYKLKL